MKKIGFRLKILIVLCLIIVLGGGSAWYYFGHADAESFWDNGVSYICSSSAVGSYKNDNANETKQKILNETGIAYPATENVSPFTVDIDTFASTWKEEGYNETEEDTTSGEEQNNTDESADKDTGKDAGKDKYSEDKISRIGHDNSGLAVSTKSASYYGYDYEAQRLAIKEKLPQIISEIEKIYGKPYKFNKVEIIFDENNLFDRDALENKSGKYDYALNAIFLSDSALSETSEGSGIYKGVIHEIIHAYNDGTLPIEAYEDGMVEATAKLVAQKLDSKYQVSYADSSGRAILKNIDGLFRTQDDSYLIDERYDASASFFHEMLATDANFIKNFRSKYQKSGRKSSSSRLRGLLSVRTSYFDRMYEDPYKETKRIITEAACDEMSGHLSELAKYNSFIQNMLVGGLGEAKKSSKIKALIEKYPVIDILPPTYLYPDTATLYTDINYASNIETIDIRSTYKVTTIQDLLPVLFKYATNMDPERYYNITSEVPRMVDRIFSSDVIGGATLQELSYLIESNADNASVSIYTAKQEELLKEDITKSASEAKYGPLASYSVTDLLGKINQPNYSGDIFIKLAADKTVDRGKRDYSCARVIVKSCNTTGLKISAQTINSTLYKKMTLKDGKVVSTGDVTKVEKAKYFPDNSIEKNESTDSGSSTTIKNKWNIKK